MASRPVENCPKCGGENISPVDADYYDPEEAAEGDKFEEWLCEDCGYTWDVQEDAGEDAEGFEGGDDEEE